MFSTFQSALKDVFLVTVQKEEELSCSIVATALACLVQKYAYAPRFATHSQCLASFEALADAAQRPSAAELASAGFFHTGRADEAVCGACFLGLRDWQPCDIDAEAVHARFAASGAAVGSSGGGCLFLTTRRILTSVLPLARKHLTPPRSADNTASALAATVTERLAVIAREMAASGCWPVENARALGYSDDLILLALWRLQAEGNSADNGWKIDPQGTTGLLKAILRVQESGLGDEDTAEETGESVVTESEEVSTETTESADVEAEVEAVFSNRRSASASSSTPKVPSLAQMLQWWANTWLYPLTPTYSPRSTLRKKAHSTSA